MKLEAKFKVLSFMVKLSLRRASGINLKQKDLQNNYEFTILYIGTEDMLWYLSKIKWCLKAPLVYKIQLPSKGRENSEEFNLISLFFFIWRYPVNHYLMNRGIWSVHECTPLLLKLWQQCQMKHLLKQKILELFFCTVF